MNDSPETTPGPEVEIHTNAAIRKLGESISKKTKLYLDQNYWILLRQANAQSDRSGQMGSLLDVLHREVSAGTLICPISESTFFELTKQSDPKTRCATASLIDELSAGVCLRPHDKRVSLEARHLIRSSAGYPVQPVEHQVWSRLSYVLGLVHPVLPKSQIIEGSDIQKRFFDFMWNVPLSRMVDKLDFTTSPRFDAAGAAARINATNQRHADSVMTFRGLYLDEVRGSLDDLVAAALDAIAEMYQESRQGTASADASSDNTQRQRLHSLFYKVLERPDVIRTLRTSCIHAACFASLRWDKKRKLRPNDFMDFRHAAAAVGYCDGFLTEKPLRTMLDQKHLDMRRTYDCQVMDSPAEALEWLATRRGSQTTA